MLDAATFHDLPSPQWVPAHASDTAPAPSGSRLVWCVAATFAKAERQAHAALHRFGFEVYLPLITVRRTNRHYRTQALFPGYLFVRLDLSRPWSPVRYAPGVFQLLMTNEHPAICPDHAVEAIHSALQAAEALSAPEHQWAPGTPCSVAVGPMAGLPAVVLSLRADTATIGLMFLGELRQISMNVDCLTVREDT